MAKKTAKATGLVLRPSIDSLVAAGVDVDAVMSLVCNNLHRTASDLRDLVKAELGVELNREQPYEVLRRAASGGRLQYIAPVDAELSLKLVEGHDWLRRARVVRSTAPSDIARQAAILLMEIAEKWEKSDLHLGVAGGGLLAQTIQYWADFLKRTGVLQVKRLFVHALVAASDDPRRSPNGFVQSLLANDLPFKTEFVGLPAPAFLGVSALHNLRQMEGLREAFLAASELDVIVTSAGAHWDKGCSGLNTKYREASPDAVQALSEAGCIGDILWQPFGPLGPLEPAIGKRAVTLLDLNGLPALVGRGVRVLLVLAPCGGERCGSPKDEMLSAVLRWRGGVTDLVVDSRAAALALSR